ncbi:MAG: aspartyl protease family protein [Sedimentisphaerales bacterium]|nr:aspartyl protease family protein [Sedimentisphaerales bacterium]
MQKTISTIVLTLLLAALFPAAVRAKKFSDISNNETLAQFNISKNAKAILLPVEFQGKEYLFELDTGSSHTLFDGSFRDKLGKRKRIVRGKTPTGSMKFTLYDAPDAYLGPLNLKDCHTVIVMNLERVSSALGKRIHGIIGMNFLKKYVVRIDFDNGFVSFLKSENEDIFVSSNQNSLHPDLGQEIPIKYKQFPPIPYITADIDGNKVDFLIDTGLKHHINNVPVNHLRGWLAGKTFEKLTSRIQLPNEYNTIVTARGKTYSDFTKSTITDSFSIGLFEYKDVIFDRNNDSFLGLPFLSRHLITFDFPNQKMYLKKGEYFERPGTANVLLKQAGFSLLRKSENIFVSSVDPNSPAFEKEIKKNDTILKINNQNVTSYGLIEFIEFLSRMHEQENENITFTIRRGNKIIQKYFEKATPCLKTMELVDTHYHLIFK